MNDYKELIHRLHNDFQKIYNCCFNCLQLTPGAVICEVGKGNIAMMLRELSDASDAIEQLVKERDAAVADMKKLSYCSNCKLCTETDDDDYYWCSVYCEWNEYNDTCENWEWRGVQNE